MKFYTDLLSLMSQSIYIFFTHRAEWVLVLAVAVVLAAGCWLVATYYSRLWNLHFRTTFRHHCLCLLAALCTLGFALMFVSVKYTKEAADTAIDTWSAQLVHEQYWSKTTFEAAYRAVKALGLEDPTRLQEGWEQKQVIAISHRDSQKKLAEVYASAAVAHFHTDHPFLSIILGPRADLPAEFIAQRVNEFFRQHPDQTFKAQDAINIASAKIKDGLQGQTDRVVWVARTICIGLFVLVQFLPFGLIGYAAYKDLKVTT